ncbi:MAG: ribonuclease P protein component [Panacagrimonas sp.]
MTGFPRAARLLRPIDFKRVISEGRKRRSASFTAFEQAGQSERARLGLTVSRKAMPRSVDRNRFKRIARESFRAAAPLPLCDVVIMAAPSARTAERSQLAAELGDYWKRLRERWHVSSSS